MLQTIMEHQTDFNVTNWNKSKVFQFYKIEQKTKRMIMNLNQTSEFSDLQSFLVLFRYQYYKGIIIIFCE